MRIGVVLVPVSKKRKAKRSKAEVNTLAQLKALICEWFYPVFAPGNDSGSFWARSITERLVESAAVILKASGDDAERLGAWYLLGGLASCLSSPFSAQALEWRGSRAELPTKLLA